MIKKLMTRRKPPTFRPRVPDDVRVYAIGDIHGCDTEFELLLAQIDADHAMREPKHQIIILLGDLVDRGPDSAGVVARAVTLVESGRDVRALAGNHEELLLMSCQGNIKAARILARNGGRETAISYGITPDAYDSAAFEDLADLLNAAVPVAHRRFLEDMQDLIIVGDYAFVHAGIRPGVPLVAQKGHDLRWIRSPFLDHSEPHEKFVVHGHTITEDVDDRSNRLGIDTGAYASGRLTAVALDGDRRWFLQT